VSLRIVTDSTADLDPQLAARHRITVVPLSVHFGDEVLRDGVDIDPERFFVRLASSEVLPTTSQPSAGAFRDVYRQLVAEGATEILSIHIPAKLSGTLDSARQGAAEVEGARIAFIDSGFTTLALGLGVIAAAEAAEEGADLERAQAVAEGFFARVHCFFLVDTLEYLRRGGRIGRAAEFVGSLLRLKPLLSLQGGEVVPIGRVRTKARALDELLERAAALQPIERMMAVHATTPDELDALAARLRALAPEAPITTGRIGPVIGVHGGPGLLAFAIVTAQGAVPGAGLDATAP
jgi:DegV family protein with EDD domain